MRERARGARRSAQAPPVVDRPASPAYDESGPALRCSSTLSRPGHRWLRPAGCDASASGRADAVEEQHGDVGDLGDADPGRVSDISASIGAADAAAFGLGRAPITFAKYGRFSGLVNRGALTPYWKELPMVQRWVSSAVGSLPNGAFKVGCRANGTPHRG